MVQINKSFIFVFLFLFMFSFASAEVAVITQENDTSVEYKIDNGAWAWLPDWLGGGTVAIFTKDYSESSLTKSKAGGHGEFFGESQLVDDINFYDRGGNNIGADMKDVVLKYAQAENITYQIPVYEETCETFESNSSQNETTYDVCSNDIVGYTEEVVEEWNWKVYNGEEIIGKFKWELTAIKPLGMDVDWVLTVFGQELLRWDWWDSDWQYKREITNLNGSISALYYLNSTILSGENLSTVRFIDYATETIELDYDIAFQNSTHIGVRLNNYQADKAYVYYGNDVATDNSNASAVYFAPTAGYYFDTGATDFTGNEIDGIIDGATLTDGIIDGAYIFDGANDFIDFGNPAELSFGANDFSMATWVKFGTISDSEYILINGITGAAGKRYAITISNTGQIAFGVDDDSISTSVISTSDYDDNNWHFITSSRDGNSLRLWVDNVQEIPVDITGLGSLDSATGLTIGKRIDADPKWYNGSVDELYFYNKALNSTEVEILYNQTQPDFILGAEQVQGANVALNTPEDSYFSTEQEINFSCGATFESNIDNLTLVIDGADNYTNATTGLDISINQTLTLDEGNHNWTCRAETVSEQITTATARTLSIDTINPNLTITSPLSAYDLLYDNQTLDLNWTVNDTNLDSCWYEYNNTITPLTCNANTTQFQYVGNQNSLIFYGNDTFGNEGSQTQSWIPRLTENSQTFEASVIEGSLQDFYANVTLNSGEEIESASVVYNGTSYIGSVFSSGQTRILSLEDFATPAQDSDVNVTFHWEVVLTNPTTLNLSEQIQFVSSVSVDNCSTYNYTLLNLSLYEERGRTALSGTIEVAYDVLNTPAYDTIITLAAEFDDVSNVEVCSSINLTGQGFAYNSEIRYVSDGYVPEFYYIQRADIEEGGQDIDLFDLNENESTEFLVKYRDDAFILVEGAIVQLQRKYISEDLYKVVEAPLTSNEGTAVLHVDLDTNVYQATVVKDGEVLDFFDNLVFVCENELSGQCEQDLLGTIDPQNSIDFETLADFSYAITSENDTVTTVFSIPSGTSSSVNIVLTQLDQFGNETLCNKTIISSGGSVDCTFDKTIGDSYLSFKISKDNVPQAVRTYVVPEEGAIDFLDNNFFIVIILLLSVVGMAFTSPEWIIVNSVITMLLAGSLWLLNGLNFVMGLGGLIWLVIAAGILILKISKQEDK